ncbi:MAG: MurT ligase domain-containing protein [Candidatus Dormibacteraeota bacterium]|nr:MurT ligase domain-containing protein [Candidatus Dormibacteraeota bacterium]
MPSGDLRLMAALLGGRAAGIASRRLHLGAGSTLPGDVGRALDPRILERLTASLRQGVVLVTGTNGKTTTAALLRTMAAGAGTSVAGNPSGSNLIFGLTAAAMQVADWRGRIDRDWMVLEVDELSTPGAVSELSPRGLVILNIYRDQLDRSFEVEQVFDRLRLAVSRLPSDSFLVANADDPRVAELALQADRAKVRQILFGLEMGPEEHRRLPAVSDGRTCPRCRAELSFTRVHYAHCGVYSCPACGFSRPDPEVEGRSIRLNGLEGLEMEVATTGGATAPVRVSLGGVFNAANVTAAAAAGRAMGLPPERSTATLVGFRPAFGRFQVVSWGAARVRLMLAKNPAGLEENLRAVLAARTGPVLAIALNDGIADGRDISWIWDADLEVLGETEDLHVVVSGTRAHELALRLAYAGFAEDRVLVRPAPEAALDEIARLVQADLPAPALLTYTAMLDWHRRTTSVGPEAESWAG